MAHKLLRVLVLATLISCLVRCAGAPESEMRGHEPPAHTGSAPDASQTTKPECYEVALESPPWWLRSGTSHEESGGLLTADPALDVVRLHDVRGRLRKRLEGEAYGMELGSRIERWTGGRYVVGGRGAELVVVDEHLEVDQRLDLRTWTGAQEGGIGALLQWTLAGNFLVGYGGLEAGEERRWGVVGVDLEGVARGRAVAEMLYPLETHEYYLVFSPLLASVGSMGSMGSVGPMGSAGESAYVLELASGAEPVVHRCRAGAGCTRWLELSTLDPNFPRAPVVGKIGFSEAEGFYERVEEMSVPVALYGWQGTVYVLTRRPRQVGPGTRWTLYGLDPATAERVGDPWELPLDDAHHLTVVPGREHWFFVLMGPMSPVRRHISKMRVIESTAFRRSSEERDLKGLECRAWAPTASPAG